MLTSRSVEPKATEGNVKAGTQARMSEVAPPPPPPPYSSHLSCLSSAAQVALVSCWGESRLTQRISQWAGLPQSKAHLNLPDSCLNFNSLSLRVYDPEKAEGQADLHCQTKENRVRRKIRRPLHGTFWGIRRPLHGRKASSCKLS